MIKITPDSKAMFHLSSLKKCNKKILIINGPNLNALGWREPEIYGKKTLCQLEEELKSIISDTEIYLDFFQSNHEGVLIDKLYECQEKINYIIINPGAFSHTSIALRDTLATIKIPFIEVHITNIAARETFRQYSYLAPLSAGVISGLGTLGYHYALYHALHYEMHSK